MPLPNTQGNNASGLLASALSNVLLLVGFAIIQAILGWAWWKLVNQGYGYFSGLTLALPSGLIIASMIGFRPALWMSALLAQILLSSVTGLSLALVAGLSGGLVLEVAASYWILQYLRFNPKLLRLHDLAALLFTLLVIIQPLSATYQTLMMLAIDTQSLVHLPVIWLSLWTTGSVEKLLLIPLILSLVHYPIQPAEYGGEYLLCTSLLLISAFFAFAYPLQGVHPALFIFFPLLSFIALRHSLALSCLSLLLLCFSALTAVWLFNRSPSSPQQSILYSCLVLSLSVSTLIVGTQQRSILTKNQIRRAKERYDDLVRRIPAGVFTLRHTAKGVLSYEYVSPRLCEIYDLDASHVYQDANCLSDKWHPDDRAEITRIAAVARAWLQPMHVDTRLTINNEERWIRIDANPIRLPNGDTLYDGIQTDITQLKQTELELSMAASVFQHSYDSIFILDTRHTIIDANPAAMRLSGYQRPQLLGRPIAQLVPEDIATTLQRQALWQKIQTEGVWQGEVNMLAQNQTLYPLQLSIIAIQNSKAVTLRYIVVGTDVSDFKNREAHLEKLAHFDPLTQLPNRHLFADRLRQAMSNADRKLNTLAVCYIDLDGFKAVNDLYGHDVGDQVLQSVAARLINELRKTDTIARLGGDELVLLLNELSEPDECKPMLERLLHCIAMPMVSHDGHVINISASIGVSFYPIHADSPELLLQLSDRAMYCAKQSGKNAYRFYPTPEQDPAPAKT